MVEPYQGAVPLGFSAKRFRETGRTSRIVKGKEVLAKDYLKKKSEEKKKGKKKGLKSKFMKKKILSRPQSKLPSTDPKKFITKGLINQPLVREGRTGYFNREMIKETKWLS